MKNNTRYISDTCYICRSKKVTLDEFYGLPSCLSFILLCPNHPGKVTFDVPVAQMLEIANPDYE